MSVSAIAIILSVTVVTATFPLQYERQQSVFKLQIHIAT